MFRKSWNGKVLLIILRFKRVAQRIIYHSTRPRSDSYAREKLVSREILFFPFNKEDLETSLVQSDACEGNACLGGVLTLGIGSIQMYAERE